VPNSQFSQSRVADALLVKPKEACRILGCGNTRLYALLAAGELRSFLDGGSRKIVVQSIHDYIARRLEQPVRKRWAQAHHPR
jgi:excisionase family DNA binding protein